MKTKYLFYFCDGIGSVFDSQVLGLLKAINEENLFDKVYLFLGIRNENQKVQAIEKIGSSGIELAFFITYPNYPFFNSLIRKSIRSAIKDSGIDLHEVIFHTRGELTAWHLSQIIGKEYNKYIVPDIRGTSIEEIREFYNLNKFQKFLKVYNNKLALKNLNNFTNISVVSGSLKEYLINNYTVNPEKIFITPSLAGKDFKFNRQLRQKVRKELNLNEADALIVFSSGGSAGWQNNDVLIMLAERGIKVLNLSKKEIAHKNIINRFVSYALMPSYLCAADAAIIWREESIVNKVASPVKFSEYICCGLPVISNQVVDMIKDHIVNEGCGIVLNRLDELEIDELNTLKMKDRNSISEKAVQKFGLHKITNTYLKTYSLL